MIRGLIGRKKGMTQIFDKDGNMLPITIIETGPCTILEFIEEPKKKIKVGFDPIKETRANKAELGYFKKIGVKPHRIVHEFLALEGKEVKDAKKEGEEGEEAKADLKVGSELKADVFRPGDYVDISGTSIGKGFQGGMKRHGWSGGPGGHGSRHHREVGSIGMSAYPARTLRGRTMPGQMGNKRATTQGLRVMAVDVENNYILVKGAVPGSKNAIVEINVSQKKEWKDLDAVKAVVQHKVNPMKQSKKGK